ncbi:hypothetical protein ACFL0U_04530 [Pseudomonadota bacterium]
MIKIKFLNISILLSIFVLFAFFISIKGLNAEENNMGNISDEEIYSACEGWVAENNPEQDDEYEKTMNECLEQNGYSYPDHIENNSNELNEELKEYNGSDDQSDNDQ